MDRLGLAAERIEPGIIEIRRGELGLPLGREAPRAVIEALAGNRDIVAVEDAVDEARGHVAGGEAGGRGRDEVEQAQRIFGGVFGRRLAVKVLEAIADQAADIVRLAEEREALEGADADVPVAEPGQDRRAGRRGLVAANQFLARLEQGERLGGVDSECLEHLGGEDFANPALERQPAVRRSAVGGLAGAFGSEVKQPISIVAKLREQEAAAIADVGIVHPELVAVVAERERLLEVIGERLEAAEMRRPLSVVEIAETDPIGSAATQQMRRGWSPREGAAG